MFENCASTTMKEKLYVHFELYFKQYFIYILTWINIVERYGEKLNATQY